MNNKFEEFKKSIKGKNIGVIGVGISNLPLIKFLAKNGARVTAYDKRSAEQLGDTYRDLCGLGVSFSLGENYLQTLSGEIIFKTPGMRFDNPKLLEAQKNGAEITSEMELFAEFCPAEIIAVTGSDGKTTTTTLIHSMLVREGYKTWLGGNIGTPLFCSLDEIREEDIVVLELSSFQLHTMKKSPHVAVITNISPNHLDMHKDYAEYIDAKKNIMKYQTEDDILVVNNENEVTRKIGNEAKGIIRSFGYDSTCGIYAKDGFIKHGQENILKIGDIKIPGKHNVENYMAAIAAVGDKVSRETIEDVAKNFGGVEHRIEFVREFDGVKYYNDSIATSPSRVISGLRAFNKKIIVIMGGSDKGNDMSEMVPDILKYVKVLVLNGATADKIYDTVTSFDGYNESGLKIIKTDVLENALVEAKKAAQKGDVVSLCPACPAFDQFKTFEYRGRKFKELVNGFED